MTFYPGKEWNGNAKGRPVGTRNKRTQEILDLIQQRGDKDPLDFLSEVVSVNGQYSTEQKIQAANYLTPYLHSKRSVAAPAPRYIDSPVVVPEFHSITEAETFLAALPVMLGKGELDSQSALELSTLTRNWISARNECEELKLKLELHHGGDQHIVISGGLPPLPGTNVKMPVLPGHEREINGAVLQELPPDAPDHAPQEHDPHDPQSPDPSESHQRKKSAPLGAQAPTPSIHPASRTLPVHAPCPLVALTKHHSLPTLDTRA